MKKTNIMIIVMAIIILGIGSYFVANFIFNKEQTNPTQGEEKEPKTEEQEENLEEIAATLQNLAVDSLVFGNQNKFPNQQELIKNLILHYYVRNAKERDITKSELDNFFRSYYNLENMNYFDIVIEDCNLEQSTLLKYDSINQKYNNNSGRNQDEWFCNGPVDFDFQPYFTKVYSIEKENDTYLLTLTGKWILSGEPFYDMEGKVSWFDFQEEYPNTGDLSLEKEYSIYEQNYEKNKAKFTKYQISFQKRNDNTFYIIDMKII